MKKNSLIRDFFIGGCIGRTLMEISGIFTTVIIKNNIKDTLPQLRSLMVIFLIGGIAFIFVKLSLNRIEKMDMKSKDRQKLLKRQMIITAGGILLFSIFLIIYSINMNYVGVILALSFCTAFSFWGYAFLLSYINLKNSMVMINKKKI